MDYPLHPFTAQPSNFIEQKVVFFLVFVGVTTLTFGFFYVIDFLPQAPHATASLNTAITPVVPEDVAVPVTPEFFAPYPISLRIDSLDKEVPVLNPESRVVSALDEALLKGVVRHPDSADLINTGTIFILGHSSYLPNVLNKNFQALNGIQNLVKGDTVRLRSSDGEYVYAVDRVYEAKASAADVPIQWDSAKLVLATCDSFGSKDDRFVVEATLVSKTPNTAI